MKTDDLLDALGEADPTYIQEAEDVRYLGARKKHFMQMAACVALLLIGGSYGIWQQYESTARTDMAKRVRRNMRRLHKALRGMATVYKRLPSRRALRELTGILTKWRNFRHRLPAGRKRRRRFHSQRNSFRTITESR